MPRSFASTVVKAHPDEVWSFLRDFSAPPQYIEAVTSTVITGGKPADQVGCERISALQDGTPVVEVLVALDDVNRSLSYRLTEGPFPFTNYHSTMQVSLVSDENASFVEWFSSYDCEAADAKAMDDILAGGIYEPALAFIKKRFGA